MSGGRGGTCGGGTVPSFLQSNGALKKKLHRGFRRAAVRSKKHYNQPKIGVLSRRGVSEGAHLGWDVWGGSSPVVFTIKWSVKKKEKILHRGLRRPLFKILRHNNQPKTCVRVR
jgi:hypothetical protein